MKCLINVVSQNIYRYSRKYTLNIIWSDDKVYLYRFCCWLVVFIFFFGDEEEKYRQRSLITCIFGEPVDQYLSHFTCIHIAHCDFLVPWQFGCCRWLLLLLLLLLFCLRVLMGYSHDTVLFARNAYCIIYKIYNMLHVLALLFFVDCFYFFLNSITR